MAWLPGWDSAESAGAWSSFYFWFGIVCLFLLGGSEVLSHWYGIRKDTLVVAAESARSDAQKRTDDAANAKHAADVKALQDRTTEAESQVIRLREQQAFRRLSQEQQDAIVAAIAPFFGQKVSVWCLVGDRDAFGFAEDFVAVFRTAGWSTGPNAGIDQSVLVTPPRAGVLVVVNPANTKNIPRAVDALLTVLVKLGLTTTTLGYDPEIPLEGVKVSVGPKPAPPN